MRRRGIGVGVVKKNESARQAFAAVGKNMADSQMGHIQEQMDLFRVKLEEFARFVYTHALCRAKRAVHAALFVRYVPIMKYYHRKYRGAINDDPLFRREFQKMCTSIGVDPLASSKGFWAEMLGVGDFYYELGVQIVEICGGTRRQNGGLISLNELYRRLKRHPSRSKQNISPDDVRRAIQKLEVAETP